MSDGERVALYLIGQSLAAPPGSVLVIDEPEVHLHRAIQAPLWDEIERERSDCLFVYLTHDLEFAATRLGAAKLWLKSYEGDQWDWERVPETDSMPEDVLLSVLGSRKPVLFTEGTRGALEHTVLSRVYDGWTVVPRGGCNQVIAATTAFRALHHSHRLDCYGLVDRDFRTDQDAANLLRHGVYVLDVHEVENLFLTERVIRVVAAHLALDPDAIVNAVKDWVLGELADQRVAVASAITAQAIEDALRTLDAKAQGEAALRAAVDTLRDRIDVGSAYSDATLRVDTVLRERDYEGALRLYGNKGLLKTVGRHFGLAGNGYVDLVKRLLVTDQGANLIAALRAVVPPLTNESGGPVAV